MRVLNKAFWIAAALSVLSAGIAFASNDVPTDVSINQSGCDITVSWTAPDFDGIDKYQVQVYKKGSSSETKNKNATVDADDTSVDFTLNSKGYYYAKVRMRDVDNKWHSYSSESNTITITSSDIGSGGSGSGSGTSVVPNVIYTTNYTGGTTSYNSNGTTYNTYIQGPTAGNMAKQGMTRLNDPNAMNPTFNNKYSSSSSVVNSKHVAAFTYNHTGWQFEQNGGMWYLNADGTYPVSTWFQIDGHYYHFDPSGYLEVNTWVLEGDGWHYVGNDGIMCTGWSNIDNKWYYFNANNGKLEGPGLITVDQKYYYIDHNGARVENGWVNGYYYGADGALTNGK